MSAILSSSLNTLIFPLISKKLLHKKAFKTGTADLPGGSVVKNPPADAGDTGSISGPGRFHMLRGN